MVILPDDKGRSRVHQIIPESPAAFAKKMSAGHAEGLTEGDIVVSVNGTNVLDEDYGDVVMAIHDAREAGDIDVVVCRALDLEEWSVACIAHGAQRDRDPESESESESERDLDHPGLVSGHGGQSFLRFFFLLLFVGWDTGADVFDFVSHSAAGPQRRRRACCLHI